MWQFCNGCDNSLTWVRKTKTNQLNLKHYRNIEKKKKFKKESVWRAAELQFEEKWILNHNLKVGVASLPNQSLYDIYISV